MCYFLLPFLLPFFLNAEIKIITVVFNRPEFISLQKRCFDTFLQDEYELIVYNNAADPAIADQIAHTCKEWQVSHHRIPDHARRNTDPCTSHATALNYAFSHFTHNFTGKVLLFENDDFLIQPHSFEKQMKGVAFGYKPYAWMWDKQGKWLCNPSLTYPHANMAFFDFSRIAHPELINWSGMTEQGYLFDTGGKMFYFLHSNPKMGTKTINEVASWDIKPNRNFFQPLVSSGVLPQSYIPLLEELLATIPSEVQFLNDYTVLHYWIGSNWNNKEQAFHDKKFQAVSKFIDKITKS